MSASSTAGGAGRTNTPTAYFLSPSWGRIAERIAPVIDRDAEPSVIKALLCVPDSGAAVELAAALRTARPEIARILPVTDAQRAARLLKAEPAPIVIASLDDIERLMAASSLVFDGLKAVGLVGADEFDADRLAPIMAAVPKEARRVLVAAEATPAVEALLERYYHKAHRLSDESSAETTPAPVQYLLTRGSSAAAQLPALLDELDPPSAVVVTTDDASVRAALAAAGYPAESPLVQVSEGEAPEHVALVVFAGLPSPASFDVAMQAGPGRAVAVIAPRQLAALKRLAAGANVTPFITRRATSGARAQEERLRAELKQVLTTAYPAREILALEPLLAEFDGAELAGAALHLLEAARSAEKPAAPKVDTTPVAATVRSVRVAPKTREGEEFPLKEPRSAKPRFEDRTIRRDAGERPRRSFGEGRDAGDRPRRSFGEGRDGGDRPRRSFGEGRDGGDRPRRSFGEKREDGERRSFGDKPRRSFGDKPRGSFGDKPRGSFGDKPRGSFGDKPRGGFGGKPRTGGKPFGGPRKRDDR